MPRKASTSKTVECSFQGKSRLGTVPNGTSPPPRPVLVYQVPQVQRTTYLSKELLLQLLLAPEPKTLLNELPGASGNQRKDPKQVGPSNKRLSQSR